MKLDELLKFISEERAHQLKKYGNPDPKLTKYTMLAKIMEEVGEFSEALLKSDKLQRESKLTQGFNLEEEFVDVLFTTLVLADQLGLNIEQALEKRMEQIASRRE